jgi:hypothetical protein
MSTRSLVLTVWQSVDLLAEPHNTLDFRFLETVDANQRRCALLELSYNSSNNSIVTKSYISVINVWENKSLIIVICHLLISPDRIIQVVNTILRRDHHSFRLAFPHWSFHSAVIPLAPNTLQPPFHKPVITINFSEKLTKWQNVNYNITDGDRKWQPKRPVIVNVAQRLTAILSIPIDLWTYTSRVRQNSYLHLTL